MGHTNWSHRTATEMIILELKQLSKAMSEEHRDIIHQLLKAPMQHIGSISYASSMHIWAFVLLTIIVEQHKRIEELEERYATG